MAVSDQIPFTRGVPSADLLPVADLRAAAAAAFEADAAAVLSYAPAGYPPLRSWIAGRHGTTPDRVVVVNGSLEGVDFLAGISSPTARDRDRRGADLRPHAEGAPRPRRADRAGAAG